MSKETVDLRNKINKLIEGHESFRFTDKETQVEIYEEIIEELTMYKETLEDEIIEEEKDDEE